MAQKTKKPNNGKKSRNDAADHQLLIAEKAKELAVEINYVLFNTPVKSRDLLFKVLFRTYRLVSNAIPYVIEKKNLSIQLKEYSIQQLISEISLFFDLLKKQPNIMYQLGNYITDSDYGDGTENKKAAIKETNLFMSSIKTELSLCLKIMEMELKLDKFDRRDFMRCGYRDYEDISNENMSTAEIEFGKTMTECARFDYDIVESINI